jgi:TPR repeat protein
MMAYEGYIEARYRLGYFLENGFGMEADPVMALEWYRLAMEGGHELAAKKYRKLKEALAQSEDPAPTAPGAPAPAKLPEFDPRLSEDLKNMLEPDRNFVALIVHEFTDSGIRQNFTSVPYKRFLEGVRGREPLYLVNVAIRIEKGIINSDDGAVFRWYWRAAMTGDPMAQTLNGAMLGNGLEGVFDIVGAIYWLRAAAAQGVAWPMYLLWLTFLKDSTKIGREEALGWLRRAADLGLVQAKEEIARLTTDIDSAETSQPADTSEPAKPGGRGLLEFWL